MVKIIENKVKIRIKLKQTTKLVISYLRIKSFKMHDF